jgi:hypothetical protein
VTRPDTITLLGRQHPTQAPSFGVREELVLAWGAHGPARDHRALRVYAATLGLCSGLGAQAGASLGAHRYDLLAYGEQLYSWLREKGASVPQIAEAAGLMLQWLAQDLFPREPEVREVEGFSAGAEAAPTSSPSA